MKELYQVLGVARDASPDAVKKAYRKLTRENHPDKNPGDDAAEERFKQANGAYEVIGDAKKRALYDEFGEMSLTQNFDARRARAYKQAQRHRAPGPGFSGSGGGGGGGGGGFGPMFDDVSQAQHTSFDDLLSQLFGGGRVNRGARRRGKGGNIKGEIKVSLMDALHGVTVPLRIEGADGEARTLDVKVPVGISDGGMLRLRGQGGSGTPNGDILLTVRVSPGRRMTRHGNDLKLSVPVTAFEALRGGPVDIPTPWGPVTLKLPRASQNGQTLRLRGKGVQPHGKEAGDLLVTLDVRLPDEVEDALLAELEKAQGTQDVRGGLVL